MSSTLLKNFSTISGTSLCHRHLLKNFSTITGTSLAQCSWEYGPNCPPSSSGKMLGGILW